MSRRTPARTAVTVLWRGAVRGRSLVADVEQLGAGQRLVADIDDRGQADVAALGDRPRHQRGEQPVHAVGRSETCLNLPAQEAGPGIDLEQQIRQVRPVRQVDPRTPWPGRRRRGRRSPPSPRPRPPRAGRPSAATRLPRPGSAGPGARGGPRTGSGPPRTESGRRLPGPCRYRSSCGRRSRRSPTRQ